MNFDSLLEGASAESMDGMDALIDAVAYAKTLPAREQKILMLFCEGYTTREIGAKVGISHQHVSRIIKAMCQKGEKVAIDSDDYYAE